VCHEDIRGMEAAMSCFTLDEGGPLAEGLQDHLANYLMRLWLRVTVVSDQEKASKTRQVLLTEVERK
jgi:hypothetical protein